MTNEELEKQLKKWVVTENSFLDVRLECRKLEPQYKKTEFYKATKRPLRELLRQYKRWNFTNLSTLGEQLQQLLDGLNFDNVSNIIEQFGETFSKENGEIRSAVNTYKQLFQDNKKDTKISGDNNNDDKK